MADYDYIEQGDCLELMKKIPDGSVDLILADPPYGTMVTIKNRDFSKLDVSDAAYCWDIALPTKTMFDNISRVLRPNGKCVLFSQGSYTSELINEAVPSLPFCYSAIWYKNSKGNHLSARVAMVNRFENILIFQKVHPKHDLKGTHPLRIYAKKVFNFIGITKKALIDTLGQRTDHFFRFNSTQFSLCTANTYADLIDKFHLDKMDGFISFEKLQKIDNEYRTDLIDKMNTQYPNIFNLWEGKKSKSNVLEYKKDNDRLHPTQKPVALLEDLIKTFSNEGDIILDFTMGSGSTCVAAVNTNRHYIGFELEPTYFQIACDRLEEAKKMQLTGGKHGK